MTTSHKSELTAVNQAAADAKAALQQALAAAQALAEEQKAALESEILQWR